MRKLKTLFCFIIFGLGSLAISAAILPLLWLIFRNADRRRLVFTRVIRLSWRFFRRIMESLQLIEVRVPDKDRENLASVTSTIIVANHLTLIDIIILVSLTKDATCIVKGKLSQNFFVRFIVANAFIANDGESDELISRSAAALRNGYNLIVFPEGTRSGGEVKFQRGAAYIAAESLADVLVLKIVLNTPFLRKGKGWRDAGEEKAVYDISAKALLKPAEIIDAEKSRNINARAIISRIEDAFLQ
jgi:1-acyl-sn-glycerol-3-phosphate acyltransferase